MMMKDSAMQQHDSSSFEIIRNEKILEELKAEPEIDNSIKLFSLIECAHKVKRQGHVKISGSTKPCYFSPDLWTKRN